MLQFASTVLPAPSPYLVYITVGTWNYTANVP